MMKKMSLTRLASVLAIIAATSSCVSPPNTEPKEKLLESSSLGLIDSPLPQIQNGWWKIFNDEQLNRLIDDAIKNNPKFSEAMARVRLAQAQSIAAGASLRPGIALDGDETRQRLSENYIYPPAAAGFGVAGGDTVWMGQVTANLSWDLDFWGRQSNVLNQTRLNQEALLLDTHTAKLSLSGAIAQAYVELYKAYVLSDIANEQLQQRTNILKLTQNRVKAGLDTQVELKSAEAALPQAQNAQLQANMMRDLAMHNLAALSGHGAEIYSQISRPTFSPDTELNLPNNLSLDLLAHRPDILAAKARVEAASKGRLAAKEAFYPDINLRAFVGLQAIGLDKLVESGSRIYGAGPALHLPLFDSQRLKANYLGATAEMDFAIANYNNTVFNAIREVADQISRIDSFTQQLQQAQITFTSTKAAYDLAQDRYASGLSSQLTLLNAQTQLLNAQRDIVSIKTQLIISRVTLLLTLGGSFDAKNFSVAGKA